MTIDVLAKAVIDSFIARGETLGVAESCTGGLLAGALTAVPGASRVFMAGLVTYSNATKSDWLGVPPDLIATHGAVSVAVAEAMASGARERLSVDQAVAITGIAGPDGGSAAKPVGLVFIAQARAAGIVVQEYHFSGDRATVRTASVEAALALLSR